MDELDYFDPEEHGLTCVFSVDKSDQCWRFDSFTVWRDPEYGTLYWAADSGCSCPVPYGWVQSLSDLSTGSFADLFKAATDWLGSPEDYWVDDRPYVERAKVKLTEKLAEVARTERERE